jgi:rare lipoprotein A
MRKLIVALCVLAMPIKVYANQITEQVGYASYYSKYENGRKTASGEIYQPNLLTAASRTLPLGTMIKVINLRNGSSVIVKVNDVGPFVKSRIIDLSLSAAKCLDFINNGVAKVKIVVLPQTNFDSLGRVY